MIQKLLYVFLLVLCGLFTNASHAGGQVLSVSMEYTDSSGGTHSVSSPTALPTTNISGITVSLSTTSSTSTFNVNDSSTPSISNWGVYFANGTSPTTPTISCAANSVCDSATISINTTSSSIPTPTQVSSSSWQYPSGTVTLVITIGNFSNNTLPQDMTNLFSSGGTNGVAIGYMYSASGQTATNGSDYALWQVDKGTLINAPTVQGNNKSIIANNMAFEITNISQPSSLAAVCPSADSSTCANSGTDGSGATTLIKTTTGSGNNSVSGYVVGFWKDSDCKIGGFTFAPNWMAYNDSTVASNYTCTYTAWKSSFGTGGTSSDLGCSSATSTTFLTGNSVTPDGNSAAIPYLGGANGKIDLQTIINTSGESSYSGSCISYVYLSASGTGSASYTKSSISNGDVYGVIVWALNSASDATYSVPNYSLAHSNIFYTTGINFELASTAKDPSLALTKDCFVVTAASGNVHSPAVIYWRIIRDTYLNQIGFTKFYYKHAKAWAYWLDKHPKLKPPLNFIFEKSGYAIYHTGNFVTKMAHKAKDIFYKVGHFVSDLFDNSAQAQELMNSTRSIAFEQIPSEATNDQSNSKANFGFDQSEQQNINVVPEDMDNDPFFKMPNRTPVQPAYDLYLKGGMLIPTQDAEFYDTYYTSQPTLFGEMGLSRIFWSNHVGISGGMLGRYMTNTQSANATVLGSSTEAYDRTFYALTSEVIVGLRYRNPNFMYIQPGVFLGGGVTRFRENASPEGSSAGSSYGITEYSPIYEGGFNVDISLSALAQQPPSIDKNDLLNEVLLRLSASYNLNSSEALSSTGYFVSAGFTFSLN